MQLSKIIVQSGRFIGSLLAPLLKTGLSLMKNVLKSLTNRVLILLGLTAAVSAVDTGRYHESSQISWKIRFTDESC